MARVSASEGTQKTNRRTDATVPTLVDVARRAQVSTATVSRCLNSPERVVEKTRSRVLEAVKELGYAPNFGAQSLAARRTNTIAAVIPTMENAIFARALQAFQEELRENGLTLLVASSAYRPELEEEQIRTLIARGADGLLLIGHDRDAAIYEFLDRRNVPYLVSWSYDTTQPQLSIGFDNRAAMGRLAERVLALGHRRIGIISAPQQTNDRARNRVAGILGAISARGIDPATVRIVETPYAINGGGLAFRKLVQQDPRQTAVMCGNDVLAVGALKMARKMGIGVPEQISLTGFDDIEIAQITTPELTTVQVPHREMGQRAARVLVGMLKGEIPGKSVKLETQIKMRETLAPPPE